MFADAYEIASSFTFPVVISWANAVGKCGSGVGSFIVVNSDGWCLTAAHVFAEAEKLIGAAEEFQRVTAEREALLANEALSRQERKARLRALPQLGNSAIKAAAVMWGVKGTPVADQDVIVVPDVDLALFRLKGFDATAVTRYPEFKDPSKGLRPGTSLARLGFPFHDFTPTIDEATKQFVLPPGALPIPRFPIEGIMTRDVRIGPNEPGQVPLHMIETSSPGLRGQSGGPIFDRLGAVWAIQSSTRHLALGFAPKVNGREEHQFLNVGLGPSVETILGMLAEVGVKHTIADH
ncbi:MAG: trypsin-like peptidase domain-containing protein [Deltaproteobacteria bacterium]|nr:trypsin-like peptidase domain-containing protein [Deltaproteobacteria bacterium]